MSESNDNTNEPISLEIGEDGSCKINMPPYLALAILSGICKPRGLRGSRVAASFGEQGIANGAGIYEELYHNIKELEKDGEQYGPKRAEAVDKAASSLYDIISASIEDEKRRGITWKRGPNINPKRRIEGETDSEKRESVEQHIGSAIDRGLMSMSSAIKYDQADCFDPFEFASVFEYWFVDTIDGLTPNREDFKVISFKKDSLLVDKIQELFPESWESVLSGLDNMIAEKNEGFQGYAHSEVITRETMAGITGGGIGRVIIQGDDSSYVFKLQTDYCDALNSNWVPLKVHEYAEKGDALAMKLAKRIPKPLFEKPIFREGYWVTLSEDVQNRRVSINEEDFGVAGPELFKFIQGGLPERIAFDLIDKLYITVLTHEVMTDIAKKENNPLILKKPVIPTNLPRDQILGRFDLVGLRSYLNGDLENWLEGYEDKAAELFHYQQMRTTFAKGDNKSENMLNGFSLDFGFARLENEVDDLARFFMDKDIILKQKPIYDALIDSYVAMRRAINTSYEAPKDLKKLVLMQTKIDAIRNAGGVMMGPLHSAMHGRPFESSINRAQMESGIFLNAVHAIHDQYGAAV